MYKIIVADNSGDFEAQLNAHIAKGWALDQYSFAVGAEGELYHSGVLWARNATEEDLSRNYLLDVD